MFPPVRDNLDEPLKKGEMYTYLFEACSNRRLMDSFVVCEKSVQEQADRLAEFRKLKEQKDIESVAAQCTTETDKTTDVHSAGKGTKSIMKVKGTTIRKIVGTSLTVPSVLSPEMKEHIEAKRQKALEIQKEKKRVSGLKDGSEILSHSPKAIVSPYKRSKGTSTLKAPPVTPIQIHDDEVTPDKKPAAKPLVQVKIEKTEQSEEEFWVKAARFADKMEQLERDAQKELERKKAELTEKYR